MHTYVTEWPGLGSYMLGLWSNNNTLNMQICLYSWLITECKNGVLELACICSKELTISITFQFHVHIRTLKWAMLGALTPWKSANATSQGSSIPDGGLSNIYQHTTSSKSPFEK